MLTRLLTAVSALSTVSVVAATATAPPAAWSSCLAGSMAALRKIPASSLFVSEPNPAWFGNGANDPKWGKDVNWLKSRFHFNFAEHHGGRNNFGVLRVLNDDLVQPSRGFGTHPHRNMEICTYIIHGNLTHKDSMGTAETLDRFSVQFMTAGTGVRHSEFNANSSEPLRFIQSWIVPRKNELEPNYGGARSSDTPDNKDQWAHLVSDVDNKDVATCIKVNQDVNLFTTLLSPNTELALEVKNGRQAYVVCLEGATDLSAAGLPTENLYDGDACDVLGETTVTFKSTGAGPAHILVWEMARS